MEKKVYLSVKEMAEALGVHPETIRNHIRDGNIPAIRIGDSQKSHWRIHRDEIRNFLYQRTIKEEKPQHPKDTEVKELAKNLKM